MTSRLQSELSKDCLLFGGRRAKHRSGERIAAAQQRTLALPAPAADAAPRRAGNPSHDFARQGPHFAAKSAT